MSYKVLVSKTFQKIYEDLPEKTQDRIKKHIQNLEDDPITPRSQCDIKVLHDTEPKKHRLRVGDYRIIYLIEDKQVKILDLLKREGGYHRM